MKKKTAPQKWGKRQHLKTVSHLVIMQKEKEEKEHVLIN